mgnify:CR=1 FL=1
MRIPEDISVFSFGIPDVFLDVESKISYVYHPSPPLGEEAARILLTKIESGKIKLAVSNTGSSIPVNSSNKIFERFYRGDQSRSRDSGGSGLGLSIAKGLADANKWKISAVSIPDVSMTITVLF